MKKGSAVVWIMAMMLIAAGVSFSATSAQAQQQMDCKQFTFCQLPGDKIFNVRLSGVSGNVMSFVTEIFVDSRHGGGMDGIHRPGQTARNVSVAVYPLNRDGYNLWSDYRSSLAPSKGKSRVFTTAFLPSDREIPLVSQLLVVVTEAVEYGGYRGFSFCKIFNYAEVAKPEAPPPPAPPMQPQNAQGPGYGHSYNPPVVSIEACSDVANKDPNSPGPPQCMGRGGGMNGFWGQAPYILIHFKGLPMGSHKLRIFMKGRNRQGGYNNLGSPEYKFTNTQTGWYVWFKSPHIVGKDYCPLYFTFMLDHYGFVGKIELSGSFE